MKRIILLPILMFLILSAPGAVETVSNEMVLNGLEQLKSGDYEQAAASFESVLAREALLEFHDDAVYWLMKTRIALGDYSEAAALAYRYTIMFPSGERMEEIDYHSARLLLLEGEAGNAILALGDFIDSYPDSELRPSALYWVGESLMHLGRLEEADAVFEEVLNRYPSSVKREASRYRRSEISLLYRERELLNLLQWSHEEYLRDAEDFYRRESEYRSSLAAYEGDETDVSRDRLLDLKQRLLDLQLYYARQLVEISREG